MAGSSEALVLHVLLCCLCQGAAAIECRGHVWIEPAPVVRMGSDISITCSSALRCPSARLLILLNYSRTEETPLVLNGSAVRLRLRDFRTPFATVTCFSHCAGRDSLVCGAEVRAGHPPDTPGNLSCAIAEGSERLECSWDKGRGTQLPTRHSLHLRGLVGDEEGDEEEEEKTFPADSPVLLSELRNGSRYSVWVQASNALGTARSAPRHLSLQELVVPALPVAVGAETTETSPPSTTTRWRSRTRLRDVRCEERHRATGTPTWHVEPCDNVAQEGPRWQHQLQSDTQFVFQVRCRLSTARSPWSAWSPPFLYSTPEAAPAAAPGVWRRLGPALPDGSHEVTVLIKPLAARDARGRILGYAVSAEGPEGRGMLCRTSGTECAVLVPPGARALLVTAHNSKGASSPARIPLNWAAGQEEFPAPEAVEVKPENQSRVLVQWQPPQHSQRPLLWFVLEWISSSQQHQEEQYSWKTVPRQETHTYIQAEAAAGAAPSVRLYAVYPDGISAPSSSPAPPEEPFPGSAYSEMSLDDDIGVLLGLSLSLLGLSVLFAVVMFKKSVRKRIKATLVSLLPEWLFEEFPHMENSTVVKSLQDQDDFPSPGLHEPFPACGDPALTEIEEVPAREERGSPDSGSEPGAEVPEDGELLRSEEPPRTLSPEQLGAYKPQLSDGNAPGYVAAGIYPAQPPAPSPEPEMGIFSGDYTSPVPQLWDQQGGAAQVCLLEKVNLILNSSQAFPLGRGSCPENPWEQRPPSDVPEQMLVPEELLSCLRAVNREPVGVNPCFPQGMGGLF